MFVACERGRRNLVNFLSASPGENSLLNRGTNLLSPTSQEWLLHSEARFLAETSKAQMHTLNKERGNVRNIQPPNFRIALGNGLLTWNVLSGEGSDAHATAKSSRSPLSGVERRNFSSRSRLATF
uniref:Uncharacterized protein n=1 Tax=Odontella aurita TaxID=265563 RepID=A0A6U6HD28_9STRA